MEFIIKENNAIKDLNTNKEMPMYSILLDFINKPIIELQTLKSTNKLTTSEKYLSVLIAGYLEKTIQKVNTDEWPEPSLVEFKLDILKNLQEDTINTVECFFSNTKNSPDLIVGYTMDSIVYKVIFIPSEKIIHEVFEINDINSFCQFALTKLYKSDVNINKCENCGKYFVPLTRNDEIYCDNIFSNGRTCKQIGYENKIKNDDVLREYRRAYKNKNSYKHRTKLKNPDAEKDFKHWVYAAKLKMNDCTNKKITLEEFKQWLNQK